MHCSDLARKAAVVPLVLLLLTSCMSESRIITGTVVDESGTPLNLAIVTVCYLGWGWSREQLVWDKRYCSDPHQTNEAGTYSIVFKGPEHMTLHATKEGWLQLQDFNNTNPQIVLTSNERRNAQFRAQQQKLESEFRTRKPGESDADYYCRVVSQRAPSLSLLYRGESISISQVVMEIGSGGEALFALRGSTEAASAFVAEVQFVIAGKPTGGDFEIRTDPSSCEPDMRLVQATPKSASMTTHIELLVPSARAGWGMEIWRLSADLTSAK
jgi:hypothetical protein